MEFKTKSKAERLGEAHEYYNRAANSVSDIHADFDKWEKQYFGDDAIDAIGYDDEGNPYDMATRSTVVWNISFELLEASIDTNIPQPFVTPEFKCEHHVRNARRVENLIKMLMDKKPMEQYNDSQERSVKMFGTSPVNLEWDVDAGTHSTVGEVDFTFLRPHHIYPQPGIVNVNDLDYVFIDYLTTRSSIKRKYSLTDEELEDTEFEPTYTNDQESAVADEDVVTLTVMWYRNDNGDICRFAYSGDLVLEDDDDYYSRKVEYCKNCGRRRQICEAEKCPKPDYYMNKLDYEELTEDLICSDGRVIPAMSPVIENGKMVFETVQMPVTMPDGSQAMEDVGGVPIPVLMDVQVPKMQPTRLPYYKPKTLPIAIRYNIRDDKSFWGVSDMEIIRDDQQECNKLTSRIHEAAMKSGAVMVKPEGVEISLTNQLFEGSINIPPENDINQFRLFTYAADISQWLVERDNRKEQAKRKIGITDSFLGQADNTAKSGYAKSISVAQTAGRIASKKVMKQAHYADMFRIIFELYLAFADEPRQIYHEDESCLLAAEDRFNRNDFYEYDAKSGKFYIDDNYCFSVDSNGAIEQQYPQLWDLVKSDFAAGFYGNTEDIDTQIMAWQHLEQMKYPFAKNIIESLKRRKEQILLAQQQQAEAKAAQGIAPDTEPVANTQPEATQPTDQGGTM